MSESMKSSAFGLAMATANTTTSGVALDSVGSLLAWGGMLTNRKPKDAVNREAASEAIP